MKGDGLSRVGVALALAAAWFWPAIATAQVINGNQLPNPRLATLTPLGGKAGATVNITVGGSDLEQPDALLFSHPGIKAMPIIPPAPPPPPPLINQFKVAIAPDVPLGLYDVRLVNKWGVSNPRFFVVGNLNEVSEQEPNNDIDQAQKIDIGTVVNGAINNPTDVDYTVFVGKKGQRVLIHCACASLDSRLNPEIRVFDRSGRQLAAEHPQPQADAFLDLTLPADGDFVIRLCQFTYSAGSAEFFYRLSLATNPWIDAIHPAVLAPGKPTKVTIHGRNLPGGQPDPSAVVNGHVLDKLQVEITAPSDPIARQRLACNGLIAPHMLGLNGFAYRLQTPAGVSNPVLLGFAQAPVVVENDDNDVAAKAQRVAVPCEIAGRIDKRRDRDWYAFQAKKGDVFIIEVLSHRLGSTTDMHLSLYGPDGKSVLAQLDDGLEPPPSLRLFTVHRDPPPHRFVVPADGQYYLLLGSHFGDTAAGPTENYRLRLTAEQPDFRLVVMPPDASRPDSCVLGQGSNQNYAVYVFRQDGFKGDIVLTVDGLPPGVTCSPQVLGPGVRQTNLVLRAAPNAAPCTGVIAVKGQATINGQPVVREARPATITWAVPPGQNIPTVTRLNHQLVLAVRDKAPFVLVAPDKAVVSLGDKLTIPLKLEPLWPNFKGQVQIQPQGGELPPGMNFGNLTLTADKREAQVTVNVPTNLAPGHYNVVFRGFAPVPFSKDPKGKQANLNVVMPSTPLALTVLPKQVATLALSNQNLTVKPGSTTEVMVRVNRQFDYAAPFKVQLILPPTVQGVAADEVTIPASQNEAKLLVRVPPGITLGNRPKLTVRAVAIVEGNVTLNHDVVLNVNVVK